MITAQVSDARIEEVVKSQLQEGIKYLHHKDYDKSLHYFKFAARLCSMFDPNEEHPLTADYMAGLGAVYYLKDQYAEALEPLKKA